VRELIFRQPFLKLLVISESYSYKSLVTPFTPSTNDQILLGKPPFSWGDTVGESSGTRDTVTPRYTKGRCGGTLTARERGMEIPLISADRMGR